MPKIIVDIRERELAGELHELGADVEVKQLDIGDAICSDKTVVERKTRRDFEASIIDKRLFKQLKAMKENYENTVVIVEGEESPGIISREALMGAYAGIITDYHVGLFFTRDIKGTADLIFHIAKHEQEAEKRPISYAIKRSGWGIGDYQRAILETFPMIGPKLADALLKRFKRLKDIFNASEKELTSVEKMGEKRARMFKRILEEEYKEDKGGEYEKD